MPESRQFNSLMIRLADASFQGDAPIPPALVEKCIHLNTAVLLNRAVIVGCASEDMKRDPAVVPQWPQALSGGTIRFEVATELPMFLPNRNDQWEYEVSVGGQNFVVMNRLVRCYGVLNPQRKDEYEHAIVHRAYLPTLRAKAEGQALFTAPLHTVLATHFDVVGQDGTEAFESKFWKWSELVLNAANKLIDAIRVSAKSQFDLYMNTHLRPIYWVTAYPTSDRSRASIKCLQVCADIKEAAMCPTSSFDAAAWKQVDELVVGTIKADEVEIALAQAKTFQRFGYLDLAIIHLCVAAESLLGRAFEKHLRVRGVPERTVSARIREISSLSLLLGVQVNLFADVATDAALADAVKALDWARNKRNDIVHSHGEPVQIDQTRLTEAFQGIAKLMEKLR